VIAQSARVVHYCPHCQAAVEPADLIRDLGDGRSGHIHVCSHCYTPTQPWPADLPLPTLRNVRALVTRCNALAGPARAFGAMRWQHGAELTSPRRAPADNKRGWWN